MAIRDKILNILGEKYGLGDSEEWWNLTKDSAFTHELITISLEQANNKLAEKLEKIKRIRNESPLNAWIDVMKEIDKLIKELRK